MGPRAQCGVHGACLLQPRALLPTQSLPEEEQQRVLGEEKMLNINKKQTTSPASKKPSQEGGKVSVTRQWAWGLGWSRSSSTPMRLMVIVPLILSVLPLGWLREAQAARVCHVHLLRGEAEAATGGTT